MTEHSEEFVADINLTHEDGDALLAMEKHTAPKDATPGKAKARSERSQRGRREVAL